jgi:hypothetical protein
MVRTIRGFGFWHRLVMLPALRAIKTVHDAGNSTVTEGNINFKMHELEGDRQPLTDLDVLSQINVGNDVVLRCHF